MSFRRKKSKTLGKKRSSGRPAGSRSAAGGHSHWLADRRTGSWTASCHWPAGRPPAADQRDSGGWYCLAIWRVSGGGCRRPTGGLAAAGSPAGQRRAGGGHRRPTHWPPAAGSARQSLVAVLRQRIHHDRGTDAVPAVIAVIGVAAVTLAIMTTLLQPLDRSDRRAAAITAFAVTAATVVVVG